MKPGVDYITFQKDSKNMICSSVPKRWDYDFRMQSGTTHKTVTMKLKFIKKGKKVHKRRKRRRRRRKKVEKKREKKMKNKS